MAIAGSAVLLATVEQQAPRGSGKPFFDGWVSGGRLMLSALKFVAAAMFLFRASLSLTVMRQTRSRILRGTESK